MAVKVICPNCKGESYTASLQVELPCPYCGKLFAKEEVEEGNGNGKPSREG